MSKLLKSKTAYFMLPVVLLAAAIIVKININYIRLILPSCTFKDITGYDCPGCGNTRSIIAFLNGDISASLKYNITPILSGIILTLLYIEYGLRMFGKNIKILPRSLKFWIPAAVLLLLYFILRNFIHV